MTYAELCERVEKRTGSRLTPLRRRFAWHYVANGGNGTQALLSARREVKDPRREQSGSYHAARRSVCRMSADVGVQALIDELQTEALDISKLTPELVIKGLLREVQMAKSSRDRQNAWGKIGQWLGMRKEVHVNEDTKTNEELLDEVEQQWGKEARRRAERQLGIDSPEEIH